MAYSPKFVPYCGSISTEIELFDNTDCMGILNDFKYCHIPEVQTHNIFKTYTVLSTTTKSNLDMFTILSYFLKEAEYIY